ncbi:MAG: tetratricopeptide repeat protein [Treponema sp.]|nr:tetratricopeptide repeat protein [Treponema sp.]
MIKETVTKSVDSYIESGKKLLKKGDYHSAIADFKKALSIFNGDSFLIYTLLSAAYREKGEYNTSIEYCNKSIETYELIDADSYEEAMAFAYNDLALTYMANNDKEQAVIFFKQSADNGGNEALENLKKLDIEYKPERFIRKGQYGSTLVSVPDF